VRLFGSRTKRPPRAVVLEISGRGQQKQTVTVRPGDELVLDYKLSSLHHPHIDLDLKVKGAYTIRVIP
jgi:hypothetical protein